MVKAIGIVNLHSDVDFVGLTERRPVASVSFLGRYALIDFVLSNMSNSTIDAVGVLIECGFISNANERGQLQSSKYHQKLAVKICDGIEKYREKYPEDTIDPKDYEKILS